MAQIGLVQALCLGPGIALFPANISSGLVPTRNPPAERNANYSSISTPVEQGGVLSGPLRGDICRRYGLEFMLLQRFYQNPDLWSELKTKYEDRQKKRILKRLKKKAAFKEKMEQRKRESDPDQSTTNHKLRKDSSSDENDEDEERHNSHASHGFIILNSRTGSTQTVIQGPITSKRNVNKDRLPNSPLKTYADHPVQSQEELDLFHCLRDLDTTWSWILWSSKDHWNPEFLIFLLGEIEIDKSCRPRGLSENIISSYLNRHQFTELYLDGINNGFRNGGGNRQSAQFEVGLGFAANGNNAATLGQTRFQQSYLGSYNGGIPPEIFRCSQVRILSLRSNHLDVLPADIGRMQKLEYLALTNNRLQNSSIPYTLSFCTKLKTLLLDDNLLDALPGFLLKMHSLETVHRHGNHNYFKATFMWYHTDVNERILPTFDDIVASHSSSSAGSSSQSSLTTYSPEPLNFLAAKSLLGHKINFFLADDLAPPMKDFIVDIYERFDLEVCENCCTAKVMPSLGYKVITFKNPYLGNTCVPFQHWACSMHCAKSIEEPARLEQVSAAARLDRLYDLEVRQAQEDFVHRYHRSQGSRRMWPSRQRCRNEAGDSAAVLPPPCEYAIRPTDTCCIVM